MSSAIDSDYKGNRSEITPLRVTLENKEWESKVNEILSKTAEKYRGPIPLKTSYSIKEKAKKIIIEDSKKETQISEQTYLEKIRLKDISTLQSLQIEQSQAIRTLFDEINSLTNSNQDPDLKQSQQLKLERNVEIVIKEKEIVEQVIREKEIASFARMSKFL